MTVFLILVFLLYLSTIFELPLLFAEIGQHLQLQCLEFTQGQNTVLKLRSSLICGTPFEGGQETLLLKKTQLLHWIVVSGGHLLFWYAVFIFLFRNTLPRFLLCLLILSYVFITGLQAPCVRAFFFLQLAQSSWFKRHSSPYANFILALCFSLILQPTWITSLSFYLSCLASLGLLFGSAFAGTERPLLAWPTSLIIFLLMSPLFGYASVNSFLVHIFLSPFAVLLLPLAVISLCGSYFEIIFMAYSKFFFHLLGLWPLPEPHITKLNWIALWAWFFCWLSLIYIMSSKQQQRRAFENLA